MRLLTLSLATLCVLPACSGPKGDTTDVGTTDTGLDPSTSTLGMSSQTLPTSTDGTGAPDTDSAGTPATSLTTTDSAGTTLAPDTESASGSDPDPSSDPFDLPPPGDSSGLYLFAVSTVFDPRLPFQFIASVKAAPEVWNIELQPLTLDQQRVTVPRQPIGDPLVFTDIPVNDDGFELDLGQLALPGQTNPVTGSDILVQMQLAASIQTGDFFCGQVSGTLLAPLMADITGSTFAAVRISDPAVLPNEVAIDCLGNVTTDP